MGKGGSQEGMILSKKRGSDLFPSIAVRKDHRRSSTGMGAKSPESGRWNSRRQYQPLSVVGFPETGCPVFRTNLRRVWSRKGVRVGGFFSSNWLRIKETVRQSEPVRLTRGMTLFAFFRLSRYFPQRFIRSRRSLRKLVRL